MSREEGEPDGIEFFNIFGETNIYDIEQGPTPMVPLMMMTATRLTTTLYLTKKK